MPPPSSGSTAPARRHPFIWVVWFSAILVAIVFTIAVWELLPFGRTVKVFGWTEAERNTGWRVVAVQPDGPASKELRPGDRLISLNHDVNIALAGTGFYRSGSQPHDTFSIEVDRAGAQSTHVIVVSARTNPPAEDVPWLLEGLVWCVPALFVGFAKPDQHLARLAFAGAILSGLLIAGRATSGGSPLGSLWGWHLILGYHFFYCFPAGPPAERAWRLLLWPLYTAGAVNTILGLWTATTASIGGPTLATQLVAGHPLLFHLRNSLGLFILFVSVIATVGVIARNYYRLTDLDHRRRIRWVVYSSIFGLIPRLALGAASVMRPGQSPPPSFAFELVGIGSTAAIPIGVTYAILKHRVLDIRVVVRRGVQYLLAKRALQTLLAVPVIALISIVITRRNLTIVQLATQHSGYLYWIGATALSLRFRQPIAVLLDRRFFREQYDRERMLVGLLNDLATLDSADDITRVVTAQLEFALHPKCIYLWHCRGQEATLAYQSDQTTSHASFPTGQLLPVLLDRDRPLDIPLSMPDLISSEDGDWLESLGVRLVVPVTSDRPIGLLMLGEKKSEEPYSHDDRRVLQSVARQIAVVHENLVLKARVDREVRIRHEVLARVDPHVMNLLKECPSCGRCFDSSETVCVRDAEHLSMSLPVDRTIAGKYRLDQLIGRGGMGSVYEARDMSLDRTVAVKILTGTLFGEDRPARRFHREARMAARLTHKNIVTVYDYGTVGNDVAYLVMERVYGETLSARLREAGILKPREVADIFELLLDGIAAAHAEGIVHRDLKPENIVGQWSSDPRTLKILDFGLAKFRALQGATIGTAITATGMVVGTVGYMSPEQLMGSGTDERTDIFAVGVMLIEALTGRRPFQGATYGELLRAILFESCHLPRTTPEGRAVDDVVQRCVAKEARDRWQSVVALRRALIAALRACKADQPLA